MTEFLHGLIAEHEMPKGRELISVEQIKNLLYFPSTVLLGKFNKTRSLLRISMSRNTNQRSLLMKLMKENGWT